MQWRYSQAKALPVNDSDNGLEPITDGYATIQLAC